MATANERSQAVHRDSIVIDTLADGPFFIDAELEAETDRLLDAGAPPAAVIQHLSRRFREKIVREPETRELYRQKWQEAGVTVVSETQGGFGSPPFGYEAAIEAIAGTTAVLDACRDFLQKVTRAEHIRQAHERGTHGVILNFQNTLALGSQLEHLERFYDFGIRIIQLTYNSRNFVGDGCTERTDAGLSHLGVELVRRMNEMGILVDLSHCGRQTALDAIKVSRAPVAFTHTFARSLSDHDRGKTDDLLKAVADTGGYIGVLVVPFFISDRSDCSLRVFADHVEHIVNLVGIDHVGVGTDWGTVLPPRVADALNEEVQRMGFRPEHRVDFKAQMPEYRSWQDWPNLTATLLERFGEEATRKILGENFLRVFEEVVG